MTLGVFESMSTDRSSRRALITAASCGTEAASFASTVRTYRPPNSSRRPSTVGIGRSGYPAADQLLGSSRAAASCAAVICAAVPVNVPKLGQLRAIAAAARVPFSVVQDAAGAQFFDIRTVWSASGEARALVQQAEQLTDRQREQLRLFLATFEPDSGPSGE
ncbi:hypothetical protein [Streptomyces sp. NBC_01435]|uniref:hypothetical protein n=1 Tax=Streptomyces sp. NBC_01435 TaxID=2903865 RepID=UPI002E31DFF1|nr:hypothetical protein [Streptomyces sp. NBC_01435]